MTLKSLLQYHNSKASILWRSTLYIVQLSHPYMTTQKTIALTTRTFFGKVISLLFNILSRLVIRNGNPVSKQVCRATLENYQNKGVDHWNLQFVAYWSKPRQCLGLQLAGIWVCVYGVEVGGILRKWTLNLWSLIYLWIDSVRFELNYQTAPNPSSHTHTGIWSRNTKKVPVPFPLLQTWL